MLDPEPPLEPETVPNGVAVPVVVEVDVDVRASGPALDPPGPLFELALGVVRVAHTSPVVEADERPVGGELMRLERAGGRVADHERDPVRAQELVDLVGEPALVPELEAVPAGRQLLERLPQPLVIPAERARQLPEHRAELRRADERPDARVKELEARRQLAQPLDVRHVTAHLHSEQEPRWALAHPVRNGGLARQSVEGRVHLDGVEVPCIELEPEPRRTARRIEDPVAPVLVVPARAADANHCDSAAKSAAQTSGVAAATTRDRPSMSSGASPNGAASGKSIAIPRSRTRSCAAAMSTARAAFSEQTASTRPAARWQSDSASEPMIRSR